MQWCVQGKAREGKAFCLGPPLLGAPLRCYAHKFSLFLVKNLLVTHIMCYKTDHKQVLCFKMPPYRNCNVKVLLLSFERVLLSSSWPRQISGQVLSSHSVVSSSRTVRPCSPWGGRWVGHWRTTWSTVCFSAPHSQAAEEAIPHLYKQEQKRPTPVRRRLSRTHAVLGRPPGG